MNKLIVLLTTFYIEHNKQNLGIVEKCVKMKAKRMVKRLVQTFWVLNLRKPLRPLFNKI
jgi:hypothetical protein